jgi:hypothetical protein
MTHQETKGFSTRILMSAQKMGAITIDEMLSEDVQAVALAEAESHADDEEIGSSDFHAITQSFLHSLGKPSIYSNKGVNPYVTSAIESRARKGSQINFYGTDYTVDSVGSAKNDHIMDNVLVTMGNGIQITLWWTKSAGCTVIKF